MPWQMKLVQDLGASKERWAAADATASFQTRLVVGSVVGSQDRTMQHFSSSFSLCPASSRKRSQTLSVVANAVASREILPSELAPSPTSQSFSKDKSVREDILR